MDFNEHSSDMGVLELDGNMDISVIYNEPLDYIILLMKLFSKPFSRWDLVEDIVPCSVASVCVA
jgi:hypothetical protein